MASRKRKSRNKSVRRSRTLPRRQSKRSKRVKSRRYGAAYGEVDTAAAAALAKQDQERIALYSKIQKAMMGEETVSDDEWGEILAFTRGNVTPTAMAELEQHRATSLEVIQALFIHMVVDVLKEKTTMLTRRSPDDDYIDHDSKDIIIEQIDRLNVFLNESAEPNLAELEHHVPTFLRMLMALFNSYRHIPSFRSELLTPFTALTDLIITKLGEVEVDAEIGSVLIQEIRKILKITVNILMIFMTPLKIWM